MINPEIPQQPLATPEHADAILHDISDLVVMQGDGRSYEQRASGAPAEVQAHFPVPEDDSITVVDSVHVSQNFDQAGRPIEEGSKAIITFTRAERRDKDLTYTTQVDYMIGTDTDGVNGLGRYVTNYETGPHKRAVDFLARLVELGRPGAQEEHTANLAAEKALGLQDVTAVEAEQISNFLDSLKPPAAQRR